MSVPPISPTVSPPTNAPAPRLFLGLEVPRPLRTLVRARESSLAILGALVGALAGLVVAGMSFGVTLLHALLFGVPPGQRLSSLSALDPYIALTVPSLGGLVFGLAVYCAGALAAAARGRPDRGQCAPWRAHVAVGKPQRRAADRLVERRRRLGRAGGRLYPAGERDRVTVRPCASGCGGGICACSWAAARQARSPAHSAPRWRAPSTPSSSSSGAIRSRAWRRSGSPRWSATWWPTCSIRASLGIGALYVSHVDTRDLAIASVVGLVAAGAGIALMYGVSAVRGAADLAAPADLSAAGAGRPRGRSARARQPAGSLLRPWRHPYGRHDRQPAAQRAAAVPAQGRSPPWCRSAPASAADCSSPRCCWARSAGACSRMRFSHPLARARA